jgi:hypothetical protein
MDYKIFTMYKSRHDFIHICLDLAAYWLIPGFTIYFVKGSNWFTTNFSVLGNGLQKQHAFAFWGLLVGIYFFVILQMISGYVIPPPKGTFFIPSALLLLTFAITTPYLPNQFPLKSFLHVIFAFLAAVCLALFLILLIWNLSQKMPDQFRLYQTGLFLIILFSAALLLAAGIVSSALEIFFTVSVTLYCRRLEQKLLIEKEFIMEEEKMKS